MILLSITSANANETAAPLRKPWREKKELDKRSFALFTYKASQAWAAVQCNV